MKDGALLVKKSAPSLGENGIIEENCKLPPRVSYLRSRAVWETWQPYKELIPFALYVFGYQVPPS
jgi:hypothetical protein